MNISELISKLTEIKDEHGDLPIWISHEWIEPINKITVEEEYSSTIFKNDFAPKRVEIS